MNRTIFVVVVLLAAMTADASDRFAGKPPNIPISTTGRIITVDPVARTMKIRGSEDIAAHSAGDRLAGILCSGSIKVSFPANLRQARPTVNLADHLGEYKLVTTGDTIFQDGADSIRFEDFGIGETVSIRGILNESVLTASRVAKWD